MLVVNIEEVTFYCINGTYLLDTLHEIRANGASEKQEEAVNVDVDFPNSGTLVNGNEGEKEWNSNNEGTSTD